MGHFGDISKKQEFDTPITIFAQLRIQSKENGITIDLPIEVLADRSQVLRFTLT